MTITPYNSVSGKKEQVAQMFDNIAHKYDYLNHFLSFGIDKKWRKKAIKILAEYKPEIILDIATGTGDFAIEASKLNPKKIWGIDISKEMLQIGKEKIAARGLSNKIELQYGDSENIIFESNFFDASIVAFGVRNFENLEKGLSEIARVLKPGSPLIILEFSKPRNFPFKQFYNFYSFTLLPFFGKFFSKDKRAYTYLPESINAFPDGKNFLLKFEKSGFENVKQIPLTFGIVSIYIGHKTR